MNWIDTNILISICTCAISLTQFLFWRYIAKQKSYEAEKGKNLATKEDIKDITDKVESVKANYNESLERHKIELQKEFETHKYISNLCQTLDNILIELISECLKAEISRGISYPEDDTDLISATFKLSRFLYAYKKRYESNESIAKLIGISREIEYAAEVGELQQHIENANGDMLHKIPEINKKELLDSLEEVLSLFLPPFKDKPEH